MKRLVSLMLTIVLLLTMTAPAMAAFTPEEQAEIERQNMLANAYMN